MSHRRAVVVSEIVEHAAVGTGNIRQFLHYGYIDGDDNFNYDGNWEARDNSLCDILPSPKSKIYGVGFSKAKALKHFIVRRCPTPLF